MNKFIKEELAKCKHAPLPDYDDTTTQIIINHKPEQVKLFDGEIKSGYNYNIKIENYIINPPPNFTLADNWNNGTSPTDNEMNVVVEEIMGKMVKVRGKGNNDGQYWSGWLPRRSFKIM